MNDLVELLTDLLERARRLGRHQWVLRAVMLLSGSVAFAVCWVLAPVPWVGTVGALLLVAGLLAPRDHVPTAFAVLVVVWSVGVAGAGLVALLPVALGLLGWHWASSATAVGRPWARVAPVVWRRLSFPLVVGVGAVVVAAGMAWALSGVVLPPALTVTGLLVCLVVAAVGVVLWPGGQDAGR